MRPLARVPIPSRIGVWCFGRSTWKVWSSGEPADRALPRKEVIQPHLPVRLPCYDFVPITNPTFDGCPPCGLAHRLRVLSAFMT